MRYFDENSDKKNLNSYIVKILINLVIIMKPIIIALILSTNCTFTFSQPNQNIRGKVYDSETQFPLVGVKVSIYTNDSTKNYHVLSNLNGLFILEKIPIGKYELIATYLTYDTKIITIEVSSGKESIINLPLQESFLDLKKSEITVIGRKKGKVINDLAFISAQQFSVEETNRYPFDSGSFRTKRTSYLESLQGTR